MNVALWIAGRYLRTRRPTAFIAILTTISVIGVTVGVGALITVMGVMSGFEGEIRRRIAGTNAHVLILSYDDSGIADTASALTMSLAWFSLALVVSGLGGLAFLVNTHAAKRAEV